jgi:hypothetical protein
VVKGILIPGYHFANWQLATDDDRVSLVTCDEGIFSLTLDCGLPSGSCTCRRASIAFLS